MPAVERRSDTGCGRKNAGGEEFARGGGIERPHLQILYDRAARRRRELADPYVIGRVRQDMRKLCR